MAPDDAVKESAAKKAGTRTLVPLPLAGPPPPPPIPPTARMYLPGPPPPGVLVPRPIVYRPNSETLKRMDEYRSCSLLKFICGAGVVPSHEDARRREQVVRNLGKIVMEWAKRVADEQGIDAWLTETTATVLTYGSYNLGAYGPESDIDALCVGPSIASLRHHFFGVLRKILEARPEVSELHSIEGARVPLMRFKFNGILVDFPYVQLRVIDAAKAIYTDLSVLDNVDWASQRCSSGVRVSRKIIELVPNIKKFQFLLRCLKLWASRRGLQGHLLGFFAGIHLAILAAYVCRRHPNASINALLILFFDIFVRWPWPHPVSLVDPPPPCWSSDGCSLMPVMLPCNPPELCSSSVTQSTFYKIKEEFKRGHALTKDMRNTDIDWSLLFAPFPYVFIYKSFLRIVLSAPATEELRDWVGWVTSRFRNLLLKLESHGIYCDPDPSKHVDPIANGPNVVFFWGLEYSGSIDETFAVFLKEDFMKSVLNNIYGKEKCAHSDIAMSIVDPHQLPKYVFDHSVY